MNSHLFTTTQKTVDVIRADETGAADDEMAHLERILQKACAGELQRSFDLPAALNQRLKVMPRDHQGQCPQHNAGDVSACRRTALNPRSGGIAKPSRAPP